MYCWSGWPKTLTENESQAWSCDTAETIHQWRYHLSVCVKAGGGRFQHCYRLQNCVNCVFCFRCWQHEQRYANKTLFFLVFGPFLRCRVHVIRTHCIASISFHADNDKWTFVVSMYPSFSPCQVLSTECRCFVSKDLVRKPSFPVVQFYITVMTLLAKIPLKCLSEFLFTLMFFWYSGMLQMDFEAKACACVMLYV